MYLWKCNIYSETSLYGVQRCENVQMQEEGGGMRIAKLQSISLVSEEKIQYLMGSSQVGCCDAKQFFGWPHARRYLFHNSGRINDPVRVQILINSAEPT